MLARSGATVGKAYLVTTEAEKACHAGYLIRVQPRRTVIDPEFLFAFTQSAGFSRWKDSKFIKATIENISAEKYADLPVPVPPDQEQSRIIRFLQEATDKILTAVQRSYREIDLLKEYRTRLITDVVTGKLDVRGVKLEEGEGEADFLEDFEENEAEIDSDEEIDPMEGMDE